MRTEATFDKIKRLNMEDCKTLFQGITVNDNGYTILLGLTKRITIYDAKSIPRTKSTINKSKKYNRTRFISLYDKHYKYNRPSISKILRMTPKTELTDKVLVELTIDNLDRIRVTSTKSEDVEIYVIFIDNKPSLFSINNNIVLISENTRVNIMDDTINIFNTFGTVFNISTTPSITDNTTLIIKSDIIILTAYNNQLYNVYITSHSVTTPKSTIKEFDKVSYIKQVYKTIEELRSRYCCESFDINNCINKTNIDTTKGDF